MKIKTILIILGILIAVISITSGFLYLFNPTLLSSISGACIGGLNILISRASHTPGQEFFHGEATANLGAECFKIAWTEEDVESYLAEGGNADKGVFGDIVLNSQTNTFHTSESPSQIVETYLYRDYTNYWKYAVKCTNSDCKAELDSDIGATSYRRVVDSNWGGPGKCMCIYTRERGRFAPFTGARERHFEATISIDGLGSKEISDEIQSVAFGDQAKFQWQGSLLGTRWIDTPFSYTPYREGNRYVLTDTNYIGLQTSEVFVNNKWYRIDRLTECITDTFYWSEIRKCTNSYNEKTDDLLKDKTFQYYTSIDFVNNAVWDVDEGDLVVNLEIYSTTFPRFTFDIQAAWLGIEYLVGEPRVDCPGDQEGFSGEVRQFDLGVTNVGDGTGVFALSLDCGFLAETISPDRVSLSPDESQTIRGTVKGVTTQEETDSCTFLAYALKDPNVRDSCTFTYRTKPRKVCIPGERKCSTDKVFLLICKDSGESWDEVRCEQNCIYDPKEGAKCAEDPSCKEEDETCTEDKDCCENLECRNNVCKPIKPGWQWNNLYLVPILLTLSFSALWGWRGKNKTGKYNYIDFLIGGALGLAIGIAAYFILKYWVMSLLIPLLGSGLALGLILLLGGVPLLIAVFGMFRRRK